MDRKPPADAERPSACPLCGGATTHVPYVAAWFDHVEGVGEPEQHEECVCEACDIFFDVADEQWFNFDGQRIDPENGLAQIEAEGGAVAEAVRRGLSRDLRRAG